MSEPLHAAPVRGVGIETSLGSLRLGLAWFAVGALLLCGAFALMASSPRFEYGIDLGDYPSRELAAGLVLAGLVFAFVVPLLEETERAGLGHDRKLLFVIVAVGLAARLILTQSTPALEDDFYRYLWDGAVVANGFNPYAASPDDAQGEAYATTLRPLAWSSGIVIERVNHSELTTIYPPVSEAVFAMAHVISPYSVSAWRAIVLLGDAATAFLVLALLAATGRSPLALALYWWNPLVIKEFANSLHMEAILLPFVLAALLLAIKDRPRLSMLALSLAAGIKLWPVVLAPVLLRPYLDRPRVLASATALFVISTLVILLPYFVAGLGGPSGLGAYAERWDTNSALSPALVEAAERILSPLGAGSAAAALVARGVAAAVVGLVVLFAVRAPVVSAHDWTRRVALVIVALLLVSPAQYPWYATWVLPFAALHPWHGLIAMTTFMPIYYARFHFLAADRYAVFSQGITWLIWVPIWLAFVLDAISARRQQPVSEERLDA